VTHLPPVEPDLRYMCPLHERTDVHRICRGSQMGSIATLRIDDFDLFSDRNDVNPTVLSIYCDADMRIVPPLSCTPPTQTQLYEVTGAATDDDRDEPRQIVEYVVGSRVAQDRLELMGFTLPRIREAFADSMVEELEGLENWKAMPLYSNEVVQRMIHAKEQLFRSMTLDSWMEGFQEIFRVRPTVVRHAEWWELAVDTFSLHVRYMLNEGSEGMYGFPGGDCRSFLRAVLEVANNTGYLRYDLTDLVDGGYVDPDEGLCAWARRQLADDFVINHKIVVLTEGKNDRFVLEGALRLLYPHLVDFYSFTDFEGPRAPGGAGVLTNTLKAFIGAGIVNRIIAIFDNVTAAQVAIRSLRGIRLPDNVRVLRYPRPGSGTQLSDAWPTRTIINGCEWACSKHRTLPGNRRVAA